MMIQSVKNWFLKSKLGKRAQINNKSVNPMQTGLLLFDGSDTQKRKEILTWAKTTSKNTTIKFGLLGYINQKKLSPELQTEFYGIDNVNWYGVPKAPCIDTVLKRHYDLCIIADKRILSHQKYILSYLDVTILAGLYSANEDNILDFIVEQDEQLSITKSLDLILSNLNKVAVK